MVCRSIHYANAKRTDHVIVACVVAWPSNESEIGVDLALIETSLFSYVSDAVFMLISINLPKKSSKLSIQTRSPPASFSFKGEVTKHTTVKWPIVVITP